MSDTTTLITGGTGFLGAHAVAAALRAGHRVRTTVRSAAREDDVRALVAAAGVEAGDALEVVAADLTADDGWAAAVAGCDVVLHVASPFRTVPPERADELIVPARDGALRVLRAARDGGVRRVVLTSSFAAIGYGHAPTDRPYTEADWTDPDAPGLAPYIRSKAIAERAAWAFMEAEGGDLELTAINPVGIFGPALGPSLSDSVGLIAALLDGTLPAGTPNLAFGVVDVRDVAELHLRAAAAPAAAGERFLATAGDAITLRDVAATLRERFPDVPEITGEDEPVRHLDGAKARAALGWSPRPVRETLLATAESL